MALIDELRTRTRQSHLELDHAVYPLIQQIKSNADYAKLLKTFYGFFQPVYDQTDQRLNDDLVPLYTERRKPGWILTDLQSLGESIDSIPLCDHIPSIESIPEAFGAFYVLEGSTMGGSVISKKIMENLGPDSTIALKFFNGYGENNRLMWNDFITSLEAHEENQKSADVLIDLSQKTFHSFHQWIIQQHA